MALTLMNSGGALDCCCCVSAVSCTTNCSGLAVSSSGSCVVSRRRHSYVRSWVRIGTETELSSELGGSNPFGFLCSESVPFRRPEVVRRFRNRRLPACARSSSSPDSAASRDSRPASSRECSVRAAGVRELAETRTDGPIRENVLKLIGNTPMVYLNKVPSNCCARIACKLEALGPCRSVKDRIALAMVEDAERRGLIKPGVSTLVEPTSGNTGVGLAFVCASKGYKLVLTMPEDQSIERRVLVQAFGAQVLAFFLSRSVAHQIAALGFRLLRNTKASDLTFRNLQLIYLDV